MLRRKAIYGMAFVLVLAAGCGIRLSGEYTAEVRIMQGKEESKEKGYSLAEVQARLEKEPRTLVLEPGGRYIMRFGTGANEGDWRVEGDALILRDDIANGVRVQAPLRVDRRLRIASNGEIIDHRMYGHYTIEMVFRRK